MLWQQVRNSCLNMVFRELFPSKHDNFVQILQKNVWPFTCPFFWSPKEKFLSQKKKTLINMCTKSNSTFHLNIVICKIFYVS
jgi:hypothetical protein